MNIFFRFKKKEISDSTVGSDFFVCTYFTRVRKGGISVAVPFIFENVLPIMNPVVKFHPLGENNYCIIYRIKILYCFNGPMLIVLG